EPEPMEYVRVCDAFGTGYFYIPGTETCLKISGYVRAQLDMSSFDRGVAGTDDFDFNARTRALLRFEAKNDTDMGTLSSFIAIRSWAESDSVGVSGGNAMEVDEAYIKLGGFKVGYGYNYWDNGLSGETDDLGSNRVNMIGYEYAADAFTIGVFVDELTKNYSRTAAYYGSNDNVGVEGQVSAAFGPATIAVVGGYDIAADDGAVRGIMTAAIGPGTLGVAGVYSTGVNAYYDLAEWTLAGEYAIKLTDKLSLTPGAQYWWNTGVNGSGDFTGNAEAWRAGLTVDYAITTGLTSKVSVQYTDADNAADVWSGYFRLQRSF
ncbi:MAG: porin, partial [Allorhizobium sp.]